MINVFSLNYIILLSQLSLEFYYLTLVLLVTQMINLQCLALVYDLALELFSCHCSLWSLSCYDGGLLTVSCKPTTSSVPFRAFLPAVPLVNFLMPSWHSGFCSGVTFLPHLRRRMGAYAVLPACALSLVCSLADWHHGQSPSPASFSFVALLCNVLYSSSYVSLFSFPTKQNATRQTSLFCSLLVL